MKYKTKKIDVRYSETDQMKFVHHSNYLKYFELARLEWLTSMIYRMLKWSERVF